MVRGLEQGELVHLPVTFGHVADRAVGVAEVDGHLAVGAVEGGEVRVVGAVDLSEQRDLGLGAATVVPPQPRAEEGGMPRRLVAGRWRVFRPDRRSTRIHY